MTCYGSGNAQCAADYVCRSNACVAAIHTAGWDTSTSSTSGLVANVLYLKRLPALAHPARSLPSRVELRPSRPPRK